MSRDYFLDVAQPKDASCHKLSFGTLFNYT